MIFFLGGGGDFYGNFICVCTWLIYTDYSYSAGVGLLKSYIISMPLFFSSGRTATVLASTFMPYLKSISIRFRSLEPLKFTPRTMKISYKSVSKMNILRHVEIRVIFVAFNII